MWLDVGRVRSTSLKNINCHSKATRMRKTSSERSTRLHPFLHPSQNGERNVSYGKFQSQNVQIIGNVHPNTNGQNQSLEWINPVVLVFGAGLAIRPDIRENKTCGKEP